MDGQNGTARVIQSPADMAALLLRSCPDDAASFARRTHRRAVEGTDEYWAEFWSGVMDILNVPPRAGA